MYQVNVLVVVAWLCALVGTSCTTRTLPVPLESRGLIQERLKVALARFINLFTDGNTSSPCKCGFSTTDFEEEESGSGSADVLDPIEDLDDLLPVEYPSAAENGEGRVVGGSLSRRFEFPWHVGLISPLGLLPFCGGSLISDRWVLTAAHCVDGRSVDRTAVLLRSLSPLNPRALRAPVSFVTVHPDFDAETYSHDLALVEMSEPLPLEQLGGAVAPICLPEPGSTPEEGITAGWGAIFVGSPSAMRLRKVTLPMLPLRECNDTLSGQLDDSMICAGGDRMAGICHRDDGGSLISLNHEGRYQVFGVGSWARACSVLGHPSVFAAITQDVVEWIQVTTAGSRFCGA